MLQKFFKVLSAVSFAITALASSARATEEIVHHKLFGDLQKVSHETEFLAYDDYCKKNSLDAADNSVLVDNFLNECCVFSGAKDYNRIEKFVEVVEKNGAMPLFGAMEGVVLSGIYKRPEMEDWLKEIVKNEIGRDTMKIITVKHIEDKNRLTVPFYNGLFMQSGSSVFFGPKNTIGVRQASLVLSPLEQVVPIYFRSKSGDIEKKQRGMSEILAHEMFHWKDWVLDRDDTEYECNRGGMGLLKKSEITAIQNEYEMRCKNTSLKATSVLHDILDRRSETSAMYGIFADTKSVLHYDMLNEANYLKETNGVRFAYTAPAAPSLSLPNEHIVMGSILEEKYNFYSWYY
ncbi:MAG: hypothetical protein IJ599_03430 [Alphaproteobacteria bacterium]|nr:hypothetical protein [Alphaproteobacteria bacterium]